MSRPPKRVEKLLLDGTTTGVVYNSLKEAADDLGVAPAHISIHVTTGKPKNVGGYLFRYLDEPQQTSLIIEPETTETKAVDSEQEIDPDFDDIFLTRTQIRLRALKKK